MKDIIIKEKVCATCGKTFIPAPQHIFVKNHKWYCKWTCYNHRNDKKPEKLKGEKSE